MAYAAHLSRREGNTLEDRVNNFRSAYAAYRDIQTSQSIHQRSNIKDTLGTEEELSQANTIIKTSLEMAARDLSKSDLEKAQSLGLISDMEARDIGALRSGNEFTHAPGQQQVEENKNRIAKARAAMNSKSKELGKDKSRER